MGDSIGFVDQQQAKDALLDVRSDQTETNWCLFNYEDPKSSKIILAGRGSGGLDQLKEHLKSDQVAYGLLRRTDQIDASSTVKFAFINFVPEGIPRMQRARLGVHSGSVKSFIGQFHVDVNAADASELSEQVISEKIQDASGSGSRVINKTTGEKEQRSGSSFSSGAKSTGGGEIEFVNSAELKDAIAEVRKGTSDWVLMSYEGNSNIVLAGKGSGGADELLALLNDDMVGYALIRKTEKIDLTEAVKFAYIRFVGDNVPRMLKARLGTHIGAITQFFSPYHVSLDVTQKSEISDDIIMKSITTASGTRVHVLEGDKKPQHSTPATETVTGQRAAPRATSTNTNKVPAAPKQQESSVKFADKEQIDQDIKDVRSGAADWCLVGYEGKKGNTLITLGKGTGGVSEMIGHLTEDIAAYGLIRKVDKIDESLTIKFALVCWQGEKTDRMHRARLGTHKGAITDLFSPYSVDLNSSTLSEITDDKILHLIQENSGTRSKVRS